MGLIDAPATKIHVAQAEGCGPIVNTLKENSDFVKPVRPNTIAKSLAIGNPADGIYAVATVRDSGGGDISDVSSEHDRGTILSWLPKYTTVDDCNRGWEAMVGFSSECHRHGLR